MKPFNRLTSLEVLSVEHNKLVDLPFEMCALMNLREFRANCNKLHSLPVEFGFLMNLEQLHLAMNKLKELPEVYDCINCLKKYMNFYAYF